MAPFSCTFDINAHIHRYSVNNPNINRQIPTTKLYFLALFIASSDKDLYLFWLLFTSLIVSSDEVNFLDN